MYNVPRNTPDSVTNYMTPYQRAVEQAHADGAVLLANAFQRATKRIRGLYRSLRQPSAKPVTA